MVAAVPFEPLLQILEEIRVSFTKSKLSRWFWCFAAASIPSTLDPAHPAAWLLWWEELPIADVVPVEVAVVLAVVHVVLVVAAARVLAAGEAPAIIGINTAASGNKSI